MKLLLTSDGLSSPRIRKAFRKLYGSDLDNCKIIVLYTLQRPEFIRYTQKVGRELQKLKILFPHIRYVNISEEKSFSFKGYKVVYVCGGNTFYIIDKLRKQGFVPEIKKLVKNGGIYIGVSAGSIIAGQDIKLAGFGSEGDPNEIGLKNFEGLGFTKVAIFPHYKSKLKKEVNEFQKRESYQITNLRDKEAIVVHNKSIRKIGRFFL